MLLKDICQSDPEYGHTASGLEHGKYRFARITDIDDLGCLKKTKKKYVNTGEDKKLHPNDLIIARTGTEAGKAYLYNPADGELVYGSFLICFHLDETKINTNFLRYYTISNAYKKWTQKNSCGSTRNGITISDMLRMPIPHFERSEQDKIVANFQCLFQSIDVGEKMIHDLSEYAQTIYDYKISELHNIGKMRDLIHLKTSNMTKKKGASTPLYNSGGITGYSDPPTSEQETVIIPNSGTLNNLFYVNTPFCAGTTVFYSEMKIPKIGLYVYYSLKKRDISKLDAGSVIPGINSDIIYNLNCYIPDEKWLKEFNSMIYPIHAKIAIVQKKIEEAKRIINDMLSYYFG